MAHNESESSRWFKVYNELRIDCGKGLAQVQCPSCGANDVHVLWVGDRGVRIGFAQVWCGACLRGKHFSRVEVPCGAPMLGFDERDDSPPILERIKWVI